MYTNKATRCVTVLVKQNVNNQQAESNIFIGEKAKKHKFLKTSAIWNVTEIQKWQPLCLRPKHIK